ncbi:hypothetical protein PSI19_16230 [Xenorhabdus khoisanae]|uniref:Thoeris anti-defense 2-like domain-containing protein n=1 Tax=Xenorhabdus khoisanae TaxID=880157 RepID=A0A0J5FWW8_9GAMM|nr:hypothetical protein [Xenorhabdus khoisanae]KMJ46693.1 hypothetical protein AB204_02425 [Xenorhabdus khoisanae]MDC9615385.1 hypothetical protein [Xenorhabdus khoisanae]
MKFNKELFYIWLLDKPSIKRDSTKWKVAYYMVCLLELYIENEGKKVTAISLYKRANSNKADLHYAVGGIKNLWKMIHRATSDYAHYLSEEQKLIINNIFADKLQAKSEKSDAANSADVSDIRLMDYPSALSLMIQRDYSIYRMNWAGGRVRLHCDKRKRNERAEFLFIAPDGISIPWNPSVQDQLAENWAVYRA